MKTRNRVAFSPSASLLRCLAAGPQHVLPQKGELAAAALDIVLWIGRTISDRPESGRNLLASACVFGLSPSGSCTVLCLALALHTMHTKNTCNGARGSAKGIDRQAAASYPECCVCTFSLRISVPSMPSTTDVRRLMCNRAGLCSCSDITCTFSCTRPHCSPSINRIDELNEGSDNTSSSFFCKWHFFDCSPSLPEERTNTKQKEDDESNTTHSHTLGDFIPLRISRELFGALKLFSDVSQKCSQYGLFLLDLPATSSALVVSLTLLGPLLEEDAGEAFWMFAAPCPSTSGSGPPPSPPHSAGLPTFSATAPPAAAVAATAYGLAPTAP